jgi:nucleotide-binding universal stress UspA family protein
MKFPKKIVVAVDLSEDMEEVLSPLRKMEFMKEAEIHLVHVSLKIVYSFALDFSALTYPLTDDRTLIDQAVVAKVTGLQEKILPYGHTGPIQVKCLFGETPAETFCEYAKDTLADLIVLAPRKSKSLFESSFGKYVSRHARTSIFMLPPH